MVFIYLYACRANDQQYEKHLGNLAIGRRFNIDRAGDLRSEGLGALLQGCSPWKLTMLYDISTAVPGIY